MADVPVCRVTSSASSPALFWLPVVNCRGKTWEVLGPCLAQTAFFFLNLSSFHLFNFLPPSLLFILPGTCSGQPVWLCWTFLSPQGWVGSSWQQQHCGWGEACSELWWSQNVLQKRDGWNLQKCIFTGWKTLSSPWSWPSLENSLLFVPLCACAKSLSNYIGSVPQLQAEALVGTSSCGQKPGNVTGIVGIW